MAATVVNIDDFSSWLNQQPANTPETAYEVTIEGFITGDDRVRTALAVSQPKYVDLSSTVMTLQNQYVNFEQAYGLVKSPVIPSGVTRLSFGSCTALSEIPNIPDSVNNITRAFYGCTSLSSVQMSINLDNFIIMNGETLSSTTLDYCFDGCTQLENFEITTTGVNKYSGLVTLNYLLRSTARLIKQFKFTGVNLTQVSNGPFNFSSTANLESAYIDMPSLETVLGDSQTGEWYIIYSPKLKDLYVRMSSNKDSQWNVNRVNIFYNCPLLTDVSVTLSNVEGFFPVTYFFPSSNFIENLSLTLPRATRVSLRDQTSLQTVTLNTPLLTDMTDTFNGCTSLTTANIPDTVTCIERCFKGCTSLVTIPTIPASVTDCSSAFEDCTSIVNATINSNAITESARLFKNCTALENLTLNTPNANATKTDSSSTGTEPLLGCSSLVTLNVSALWQFSISGNVNIEEINYHSNSDLTRVTISGCTALTTLNINIPNCVPSSEYPYNNIIIISGCSLLDNPVIVCGSVNIPDPNHHTDSFFSSCSSLKSVSLSITQYNGMFKAKTHIGNADTIENLTLNLPLVSSIEFENTSATTYFDALEDVTITANNSTSVDLSYCTALENVSLTTNSATHVSFEGCTSLETAPVLPSSLTDMTRTFKDCTSLLSAPTIPGLVTTMESCFEGCTSFDSLVTIPNSVTNLKSCFEGCTALTESQVISNYVTNMENTFKGCSSLEEIPVIPNGVVNLKSTFENCTAIEDIDITHNNGNANYNKMFAGCTSLESVRFISTAAPTTSDNNCSEIFNGCTGLKNVYIDLRYARKVFYLLFNCPLLEDVYLNVNSLQSNTDFRDININSTHLNSVTYLADSIEELDSDLIAFFKSRIVTLRMNSLKKLQISSYGSQNTKVESIYLYTPELRDMQNTFCYCSALSYINTIPNKVTNMYGCFQQCTSLVNVPELPTNVINVYMCFYGCTSLEEAPNIPDGAVDWYQTFAGCSSLTQANKVHSNVTNLTQTFSGCTSLAAINDFEADLVSLVNNNKALECFDNCTSLTKIGTSPVPTESTDWHVYRLKIGVSTVEGKVFDKDQTAHTISSTSIAKSTLTLPILTDELWFPTGLSDTDLDTIIDKMIQYRYGVFNKTVIPPDRENFVLWAKHPSDVVTNFPGISVVDTVADGNMSAVTSNAVYNFSKPVDSVTSGNMKPVTSNAVANYKPVASSVELNANNIIKFKETSLNGYRIQDIQTKALYVEGREGDSGDSGGVVITNDGVTAFGAGDTDGVFRVVNEDNPNGGAIFKVMKDGTVYGGTYNGKASQAARLLIDGATWDGHFMWNGQGGQPTWLWGSNDGVNHYVWNPSNFSVAYASSAGSVGSSGYGTLYDSYGMGMALGTYCWIAINGMLIYTAEMSNNTSVPFNLPYSIKEMYYAGSIIPFQDTYPRNKGQSMSTGVGILIGRIV